MSWTDIPCSGSQPLPARRTQRSAPLAAAPSARAQRAAPLGGWLSAAVGRFVAVAVPEDPFSPSSPRQFATAKTQPPEAGRRTKTDGPVCFELTTILRHLKQRCATCRSD